MPQELIYTSAPRGLKPGTQGFCTVVSTQGMPVNLALQLETLSGYRHLFPPGTQQEEQNPVLYSHLRLRVGGGEYHVLSRICSAGVDYSRRSNKLAHHVVLKEEELPDSGPAWLMSQPGFLQSRWDGQVRLLPVGRPVPLDPEPISPQVCHTWQRLAGDAGWAGLLAETALTGQLAVLVFPVGVEPLPLLAEALALLPPELRWKVTFTTYYLGALPSGIECQWRCVFQGTPEELMARRTRGALVLDLTRPMGPAPESDVVAAARQGKWIRPPTPEPVARAGPTPWAKETAWPKAPVDREKQPYATLPAQTPPTLPPLPAPPDHTLVPEVPLPRTIIYGFRRKRRVWLWVLPAAAVALALLLGIGLSLWLRWQATTTEVAKKDTQQGPSDDSPSTQGKKADFSQTTPKQTSDSKKTSQTKGTSQSQQLPGEESQTSSGPTASGSEKPKEATAEHPSAGQTSSASGNTPSEKPNQTGKPEEKSQASGPSPKEASQPPTSDSSEDSGPNEHQTPKSPGKTGSLKPEKLPQKPPQQPEQKPPSPEHPAAKPKRYWLPIPDWKHPIQHTAESPVKIPLEHLSSQDPQTLRLEWVKPEKLDAFPKLKNADASWADQKLSIHEKVALAEKLLCSFTLSAQERPLAVHFDWANPVPKDWQTWRAELTDSLLVLKERETPLAYIQLRQAPKLEPLRLEPGTVSMGVRKISTKIPVRELTFELQLRKPPGEQLRKDSSNPNLLPTFSIRHSSDPNGSGKSVGIKIYMNDPPHAQEISIHWKYEVTVEGLSVSEPTINHVIKELDEKIKQLDRQMEEQKKAGHKPEDKPRGHGKNPPTQEQKPDIQVLQKEKSQYEKLKSWLEKWQHGAEIHYYIYHIVKDDKGRVYPVYVGFTDEGMLPALDKMPTK